MVWASYEYAWGGTYQSDYQAQSLNHIPIDKDHLQPLRFQGQFFDPETSLHYNRFRYYDTDLGMFIQRDPIGLLGGSNVFQYAPNPVGWVDVLGLSKDYFVGSIKEMPYRASEMNTLQKNSKKWNEAIIATKKAFLNCNKFQVRTESSTDAKLFLYLAFGNMDRRKEQAQLKNRKLGKGKYKKGYEQHTKPESGKQDLRHIKFYNGCMDGHIFYNKPN